MVRLPVGVLDRMRERERVRGEAHSEMTGKTKGQWRCLWTPRGSMRESETVEDIDIERFGFWWSSVCRVFTVQREL